MGVGNNPINKYDPTGGIDKYRMDKDGNISLFEVTTDNFDELYSADGDLIAGGVRKGIWLMGKTSLLNSI